MASAALAQETPLAAGGRSAPPPEDPIAAAKRDFNALKAPRGTLDQPKVDFRSLSAPELRVDAPLPRLPLSTKPDPALAKKSANWLVDAMMKPAENDPHDPRAKISDVSQRDRLTATTDASGHTDSLTELGAQSNLRDTTNKKDAAVTLEKKSGPEFNPLTSYMAGWMTPQDYTLLKPGLDHAATASLASRSDPSLPVIGADLSVLGDTGSALDLSSAHKSTPFASPKPADNPFLPSLNVGPAPTASTFAAPTSARSLPASPPYSPPPIEVAPPKSKIPDFAKPAADEKYFKQLKRF